MALTFKALWARLLAWITARVGAPSPPPPAPQEPPVPPPPPQPPPPVPEPVPDPPGPPPEPVPPPVPPEPEVLTERALVEQVAEELGRPDRVDGNGACRVTMEVCRRLRARGDLAVGMLFKNWGEYAEAYDFTRDILAFKQPDGTLRLIDCLASDGGLESRPAWNDAGTRPDWSLWREPPAV